MKVTQIQTQLSQLSALSAVDAEENEWQGLQSHIGCHIFNRLNVVKLIPPTNKEKTCSNGPSCKHATSNKERKNRRGRKCSCFQ
jgi:hypothetical protein